MSGNTEQFVVDVVGETSEKTFKGLFKTKLKLSHRDYLRQDEVRRDLLGPKAENPSARAANTAEIFSFIAVHLLEAPQWWTANSDGLDLEDDNVVGEVYRQILAAKEAAQNKVKTQAEADKKAIAETK